MKFLPLTQGFYAIVDNEEYERLSQWKWRVQRSGQKIYVVRTMYSPGGKKKTQTLHREVLNMRRNIPGMVIDHADGNTLDNRRQNLRLCTYSQNAINQPPRRGKQTSKYKGVRFRRTEPHVKKPWMATIHCKGKRYHLGNFFDEFSAVKAYNSAAYRLFGKFAYLNNWDGPTKEKGKDNHPDKPDQSTSSAAPDDFSTPSSPPQLPETLLTTSPPPPRPLQIVPAKTKTPKNVILTAAKNLIKAILPRNLKIPRIKPHQGRHKPAPDASQSAEGGLSGDSYPI
ncbi:HNH endonuclease [Planctomycetota bacterium]